jgi:hypothetical protein
MTIDRRGRIAVETTTLLVLPILVWWLLKVSLIIQDWFIDPQFYTGYGRNFSGMYAIYGWTYYVVRFPVMMLNNLFPNLFSDPVIGHSLLRYCLVLVCGIPLYIWARRSFGRAIALTSYLFLITSPLLLRAIAWDLTTFVAIPFAIAGIATWLTPTSNLAFNRMLAGFFFCTAIGAHAFTGTAIGLFLVLEGLRRLFTHGLKTVIAYDVAATVLGAAVCLACGLLFYYVKIGKFDPLVLYNVTATAAQSGVQYAVVHSRPPLAWLSERLYVYVPYLLLAVIGLGLRRRIWSDTVEAHLWWFAAIYAAAYAIYQFVFSAFVLETFFYFHHLGITVFFLFPAALWLLFSKATQRERVVGCAITSIAILILPALCVAQPVMLLQWQNLIVGNPKTPFVIAGVGVACMVLIVIARHRLAACFAAAFLTAFTVQTISTLSPEHRIVFANPSAARERATYRATFDVVDIVKRYGSPTSRVMMWYPFNEHSIGSFAAASLLFTVHSPHGPGPGMPSIGDHERASLKYPTLRYLLLMSENDSKIADGLAALRETGLSPREVLTKDLGDGPYRAKAVLVEIRAPT